MAGDLVAALTLSEIWSGKQFQLLVREVKLLTRDKEWTAYLSETRMLHETPENLDALIREEKQRVAVEFIQEAWNSALREGIEPSILADSGLRAILTQFYAHDGEKAVVELIDGLSEKLRCGQFDANRVLQ